MEAFESLIKVQAEARLNIFYTGGRYDKDMNASFGELAQNAYQNFYAKWIFIGQAGIVADQGLFCHGNTEELSLKRTLVRKPGFARIIISDWSKIGIPAGLCFGEFDKLRDNVNYCTLITTLPNKDSDRVKEELTTLKNVYKINIIVVYYNVEEYDDSGKSKLKISLSKVVDWDKNNGIGILGNRNVNYLNSYLLINKDGSISEEPNNYFENGEEQQNLNNYKVNSK
jgi:hypothetical protein